MGSYSSIWVKQAMQCYSFSFYQFNCKSESSSISSDQSYIKGDSILCCLASVIHTMASLYYAHWIKASIYLYFHVKRMNV